MSGFGEQGGGGEGEGVPASQGFVKHGPLPELCSQ
jgi:hypothetical protein